MVHLSPKCFKLLETLIDGQPTSFRETCFWKSMGGDVYVEARTVDVHIRRLKALNAWDGPELVRTVRGSAILLMLHQILTDDVIHKSG